MKIIKLTDSSSKARTIYINAEHVVAIQEYSKYTEVLTLAAGGDGQGKTFAVRQTAEEVVAMLTE
ncbi:hypothetical protein [Rhizobium leguminosarum]|uniref:hypothetical protein n=1 Tax=Rhizobium leguminosarum TaxID=384 RepID=UPI003F981CA2